MTDDKFQFAEEGGGFLDKKDQAAQNAGEVSTSIIDISRRLRVIEERYANLRKSIQLNEQNMLATNKRLETEIKTTNADVDEIKKEIANIKDEIMLIVKELRETAKKEEVAVLEKYINLWEPVNFVTQAEVEKIVKRIIEQNK